MNITGFVPFGFFVVIFLLRGTTLSPSAAIGLCVVIGALISLGIETAQVNIPSRSSSLLDLVNNTIGTCIGAWSAIRIRKGIDRCHSGMSSTGTRLS